MELRADQQYMRRDLPTLPVRPDHGTDARAAAGAAGATQTGTTSCGDATVNGADTRPKYLTIIGDNDVTADRVVTMYDNEQYASVRD